MVNVQQSSRGEMYCNPLMVTFEIFLGAKQFVKVLNKTQTNLEEVFSSVQEMKYSLF